ncbi:hypothetical protein, partial [Mesorhizobium sp. M1322]|uniref:hypothetical protein n=1 Tax=Mesorhizobium sp. M1322 TaxID=2957081 RepID=UPI00333C3D4D
PPPPPAGAHRPRRPPPPGARTAVRGARPPRPGRPAPARATAGAVPLTAPATNVRECNAGLSCIRTEDGTVIVFDRRTGRAVSGATREAAEAKLGRRR